MADLLGHADGGVTAGRHYAKWLRRALYTEPLRPGPGEVVTDLIARLEEGEVEVDVDVVDAPTSLPPVIH